MSNARTDTVGARSPAKDGIGLPVRPHETEIGSIVDADGREVCVVDVNRESDDEAVRCRVGWIVLALNRLGVF